jgi:hypothetical protein
MKYFLLSLFLTVKCWAYSPAFYVADPRGGQRGSEVEVHFYGDRIDDFQEALFYRTGLTLQSFQIIDSKHVVAKIAIAADAPLGEHQIRLRTNSGISEMRLFQVGQFPTVYEVEPNNSFDQPQVIPLNSTVQGVVKTEDIDYYVCSIKKGQRLTAEVEAIRLGETMFDAYVAILDPKKFELSANDDTPLLRSDCYASIIAPEDGNYRIVVRESAYEGSDQCSYRLNISESPRPTAVSPCGAKYGETVEFEFIGDPSGSVKQSITLPVSGSNPFPVFNIRDGFSSSSPNWIWLSNASITNEVEPNNSIPESNLFATAPCAAQGILTTPNDRDYFKFTGKKDQKYQVRLLGRSLRSPIDSVIEILDFNTGAIIAVNDDNGKLDSSIVWQCAADGDYSISVRDQLGKGGADFTYRLEISLSEPSISAALITVEAVSTQKWKMIAVPRGNRYATVVNFTRENIACDLQVIAESLPVGVSMTAPIVQKGVTSSLMMFESAADAAITGGLHTFKVKAVGEDVPADLVGSLNERIEHIDILNEGSYHGTSVDKISVAVIEESPVKIELEQPLTPIVKNGVLSLKVRAIRTAFDEAFSLRFLWSPSGIGAPVTIEMPKGISEVIYEINANNEAAVGVWPIAILAEIATPKGVVLVASNLVNLTIAEPFLSMNMEMVATEQAKSSALLAKIDVTTPFEGSATAELMGLPYGVTSTSINFTKDQKNLTFPLTVAANATIGKHANLFCRVTIPQNGSMITHQVSYGGVLRIDAPTVVAAPAEAPKVSDASAVVAPIEKPQSRLEQLRLKK